MATHTLRALAFALSPTYEGITLSDYWHNFANTTTFVGDADGGLCLQSLNDGKYIGISSTAGFQPTACYFEDDAVIPISATINSVQLQVNIRGVNADIDFGGLVGPYFRSHGSSPGPPIPSFTTPGPGPSFAIFETAPLPTNLVTSGPWARADLFSDGDGDLNGNGSWGFTTAQTASSGSLDIDYVALIVDYTIAVGPPPSWFFNPVTDEFQFVSDPPGPEWVPSTPSPTLISVTPNSGT